MNTKKIAIIGGGAAGMMAAASILESFEKNESPSFKPEIHLFEKNSRLGAKVIISGGGRCNVTTGTFKRKELLQYYTRGAEFLDYSFREFGPKKVQSWFEDHGVPLKQEDDGRIFPVSDDGKDIVGVFEKLFSNHEVSIHFKETATQLTKDNNQFLLTTPNSQYLVDIVVIATGGEAYAHTGSTGDGYSFARAVGHTITPLGPSLNSFMTAQERIHECSGISFPNARLQAVGKPGLKQSGPVLLTHFGITGPHTFVLASHCAFEEISEKHPLQVSLQIDADKGFERWDQFFLDQSIDAPKRSLLNILATQLPKRFVENFLLEHALNKYQVMCDLTKDERKKLSQLLGIGFTLDLIKRRPGDEFVTAGGVETDEVNPKTMESLIAPGVYFVGEVLNADGVTGGYNLQASWATGKIAGESIANTL